MKYIFGGLLMGAICLVVLSGDNGVIHYLITGTDTANYMVKVGSILAIALSVLVGIILKVVGGRGKKNIQ